MVLKLQNDNDIQKNLKYTLVNTYTFFFEKFCLCHFLPSLQYFKEKFGNTGVIKFSFEYFPHLDNYQPCEDIIMPMLRFYKGRGGK